MISIFFKVTLGFEGSEKRRTHVRKVLRHEFPFNGFVKFREMVLSSFLAHGGKWGMGVGVAKK